MVKMDIYLLISLTLAEIIGKVSSYYCGYEDLTCKSESGIIIQNTMCVHRSSTPIRKCGEIYSYGLTDKEKSEILKIHNQLRDKVAKGQEKRGAKGPQPAGIIPPLVWNDQLSLMAQRWANQCVYAHDECRKTKFYRYIGQNVALRQKWFTAKPNLPKTEESWISPDSNSKLTDMVQGWYDEVADFDARQVTSFQSTNDPNKKIGHYTQVIWGETKTVGCGVVRYYKDVKGKKTFHTLLVCNYGPGGNYIDEPVYKTKPVCKEYYCINICILYSIMHKEFPK